MGIHIPDGYGLARLGWRVTGDSEPMVTTFGFSGPGAADADDCAGLIHDNLLLTACVPSQMQPQYVLQPTEVTLNDGGLTEGVAGTPVAGTLAGASTSSPPVNCAILVTKYTARAGRRGKGRFYVPPFCIMESNIDPAGFIAPADIAALTTRWQNFRTNLVTAGIIPVLLHADELDTPNLITSMIVQPQIATQRRRLR